MGQTKKDKARVLVVDDDARIAALLSDTLAAIGYRTVSATSGSEALGCIAQTRPDIVITDLKMPEMDGFSLLREIKDKYPDLVVVAITGEILNEVEKQKAERGADGFLTKPFRIGKIEELIENLLSGAPPKRTGPSCILIVDDDPEVRQSLAKLLVEAGYETLTAPDADQGLALLATRKINFVITDVVMPGLSGPQLVRIIKSRYPDLPVALITGKTDNIIPPEKDLKAADAFLHKPIRLSDLTKIIGSNT